MIKTATKVNFIWHMHQPSYKHPDAGYYVLPWVRLHGMKDYWGMAKTVEKFDKAQVTFNFSGILLQQLHDYIVNNAQDYYGILTLKNPSQLTHDEREFIINRFFSINFERFVRPHRRYMQLHNKKIAARHKFSAQELGDLQALFNLSWFHPYAIQKDKHLKELVRKEKNYHKEDRQYIMDKQYALLAEIVPLYKKLLTRKRIEVTITPHHHPIMPLIYDTDILKDFPYAKRPHTRFSAPNDCVWHLNKAREFCDKVFDYKPSGSWPSEGSVSEDVVKLYAAEGFDWIGADEAILFKSLTTEYVNYDMIKEQRHILYKPYNFHGANMFFRDRNLSDTIGFVYQGWEDPVFAANDLLEHFKRTHYYIKDMLKERVITIIMDGENAWEYYKNNGVEFLETLYSALEKSSVLCTTTPSQFLKVAPAAKNLDRLASGSWINGDFGVWIGNKENNNYWDTLKRIRDVIDHGRLSQERKEQAMEYFHLIEGSDWFWWNTFDDVIGEFKKIFAAYVDKIYAVLGKKVVGRAE